MSIAGRSPTLYRRAGSILTQAPVSFLHDQTNKRSEACIEVSTNSLSTELKSLFTTLFIELLDGGVNHGWRRGQPAVFMSQAES